MSQPPGPAGDQHATKDYELRVQGHLDARWAARLEAASLVREPDGATTILVCGFDQAALHGLLKNVRDLGLPLVSVTQSKPNRAGLGRAGQG